ncbi:MAG: hydrogenase maturation nickel metallochaperone HypA [Armatimonadetes bacterium]|nr:hydrogenase maturation nickel metallochaperone HypA [Armatimonadota bacterium]
MHEHSMADALVATVEHLRLEAGAQKVCKAVLRVSELSPLTPDALQMMIDHAAEEMGVHSFPIEVVCDGLLGHCPSCGVVVLTDELACSQCGVQGIMPAADEAILVVSCDFE